MPNAQVLTATLVQVDYQIASGVKGKLGCRDKNLNVFQLPNAHQGNGPRPPAVLDINIIFANCHKKKELKDGSKRTDAMYWGLKVGTAPPIIIVLVINKDELDPVR
ncbi:hypothetical protein QQP08_015107 [Theobroma cacao]|nr:hypothetical protein QQP08_015107 [Theobroma cacao]